MRAPLPLLALSVLAGLSGAAAAAPPGAKGIPSGRGVVIFGDAFDRSPERQYVALFDKDLANLPMKTAMYDLVGAGRPDILVRITDPKQCDSELKRCRTMVYRESKDGWAKVLDRRAETVEATDPGYAGVRTLSLDGGREVFSWDRGGYRLDIGRTGKAASFTDAPATNRALLVAQFSPSAQVLAQRVKGVSVRVAMMAVRDDGAPLVMARMEGPGACGRRFGCPWRLLEVKGGKYAVVAEGMGGAKATVMPVARGGLRDVAVDLPDGYAVYGWTGSKYVVAERQEGSRR